MDNKVEEVMDILQEECAEVIQVISKMHRFGIGHEHVSSHRGITNTEKLEEEVGDLLAMIDLLVENNVLRIDQLNEAKQKKIEKLHIWSKIYE